MYAVRHRAERQVREELADQHEKRIARRVSVAEEIRPENEQPVVLERDGARRGGRIERKERQGDDPGLEPVPASHQRRGAAAPPQVNEAVVKKFQNEAISAPARPASQ